MSAIEYYDHTTFPSQGAAGSSAAMRAELETIEAAFGKLPTLAGNGGKIAVVNAGGTALEATSTPNLGAATGTSFNGVTITPVAAAVLTLANGSTLATSGAYSATFTLTAATNVTLPTTGTLATLAGTETLTNKTLTNPAISSPTGITATNISNTPAGNIAATTVQAALNELDAEKAKSGPNSDITSLTGLTTPLSRPQGGTGVAANAVIVDRAYAGYTTNAALLTTIPFDNTKPQVTEGTEILSASITPKSTTSRVRARFQGTAVVDAATQGFTVALFRNGGADAIASTMIVEFANQQFPCVLEFEDVPGSTSAQTYTIRAGAQTNQARFNGSISSTLGGNTQLATLILEEISV